MKLRLEGSRLKIVRAKVHLDALKSEIGKWGRDHLHEVPVQVDGETVTVALGEYRPESPTEWSLLAGDCVANLRASLDHILWEVIAKTSSPKARVGSKRGRDVQFPIGPKASRVKKIVAEFEKPPFNLPASAARLIKRVQPYKAGYKPLAALSRLVNRDKHCLLLVAITDVHLRRIEALIVNGQVSFRAIGNIVSASQALHTDAPMAPGQTAPKVEVQGEITAHVAFRYKGVPPGRISNVLESMVECVERIRDQFLALEL